MQVFKWITPPRCDLYSLSSLIYYPNYASLQTWIYYGVSRFNYNIDKFYLMTAPLGTMHYMPN